MAILAALRRRDATGQGAHIDMSLLDTQVAVLANQGLNWMASGTAPTRMGNDHPNLAPYRTFPTLDGDLIIAVGNDRQFASLCRVLDLPLAQDACFATNPARVKNRSQLAGHLERALAVWTRQALAEALEAAGVPAGPVYSVDEAFKDAHVVARGMAIRPEGIPGIASPIVIDGERMISPIASPPLAGAADHPCGWRSIPPAQGGGADDIS